MTTGARPGAAGLLRRLTAAALGLSPAAFVIPGMDTARALGLDPEAAGLTLAATPRHASVLLQIGELPQGLRSAAAVVYAQMPRPRLFMACGAGDTAPLPPPDVKVGLDQQALRQGVEQVRRLFGDSAWTPEPLPFEAEGLSPKPRKPAAVKAPVEHGSSHGGPSAEAGGGMKSAADGRSGSSERMSGMGGSGSAGMKVQGGQHAGMQMGGGMGFMSMVRLTQNQPRSADGLPMERVRTPFGPFFRGLPSGLDLALWLDGDTIARAEAAPGAARRGLEAGWPGDAAGLPERLEPLDPFSPTAYGVLALRALESAAAAEPPESQALARVRALETERAASHLNWLAELGYLLGSGWLRSTAAQLHGAVRAGPDDRAIEAVHARLRRLARRVERDPLLRRRLVGVGVIDADRLADVSGPVARAGGAGRDARLEEPVYQALGFRPVTREGADAWARLCLRLAEIDQSLAVVRGLPAARPLSPALPAQLAGEGRSTIETPRGRAALRLAVESGVVRDVTLQAPSAGLIGLVEPVAVGAELADALTGVASLDISPWEVDR